MIQDKTNVLVIEDLKVAQFAAFSILKDLGCEVSMAATGMSAFNQLLDHQFDIIFVDIQLPDIDGFNFAETLRTLERKRRTPSLQ